MRFSVRRIPHGAYIGLWLSAPRDRMPLLVTRPDLRVLPVERLHTSWHEAYNDATRRAGWSRHE